MGGARAADRLLGMEISPLNRRRLQNFRANARGFWSLWIFLALFVLTLFAEFIANDRPFLVYYDGDFYVPVLADYPETTFGGSFETATEYKDPVVQELIGEKGWMIRSEEHTSELQSLMRNSYAVCCVKQKKTSTT